MSEDVAHFVGDDPGDFIFAVCACDQLASDVDVAAGK